MPVPVEYRIVIDKVGTGAAEAAAEFNQLRTAATAANQAIAATGATSVTATGGVERLRAAGAALRATGAQVAATMALLGGPRVGQVSMTIWAVSSAMRSAASAARALGIGLAEAGALGAVAAASIGALAKAVTEYTEKIKAQRLEAETAAALEEDRIQRAAAFRREVEKLVEAGKLRATAEDLELLQRALTQPVVDEATLRWAREFIMARLAPGERLPAEAREREARKQIESAEKFFRLQRAEAPLQETLAEQLQRVNFEYEQRLQLYKRLAEEGYITTQRQLELEYDAQIQYAEESRQVRQRIAEEERRQREEVNRRLREQLDLTEQVRQAEAELRAVVAPARTRAEAVAAAREEYEARVRYAQQLLALGEDELAVRQKILEAQVDFEKKMKELQPEWQELRELQRAVAEEFAAGFSGVIVDSIRRGRLELGEFFADFAARVAQMYLQLVILRGVLEPLGFLPFFGAGGGVFMAQSGYIGYTRGPTYLPRWNVLAGEAGRELLAVLAAPRRLEIGGLEAIVGRVGSKQVAVADARALANAQGRIVIEVQTSPEATARIIETSIEGAIVRVTRRLTQPSQLRDVARANV